MKKMLLLSLIIVLFCSSFSVAAHYNQQNYKNRDLKYRPGLDSNQIKNIPYYEGDKKINHLPYYEYRLDKPYNLKDHYREEKQKKVFNLKKENFEVFQIK